MVKPRVRAGARLAGRAADALQLAAGKHAIDPLFRGLDALVPGFVAAATHEPDANRGRSFIANATAAQKAIFVLKMLGTRGVDFTAPLAALERRLCPSLSPQAATTAPGPSREIIFLGDLLYQEGLSRDTLSPRLRQRLAAADRLVINLEGTIGPGGSELYPFQSLRGLRQLASWNRTGDAAAWVSRFDERELRDFLDGLPPVVFGISNNHVLDEGRSGLGRTLDAIARLGAASCGSLGGGHPGVVLDAEARVGLVALSFGHNHGDREAGLVHHGAASGPKPRAGGAGPTTDLLFASVPYELPRDALVAEAARLRGLGAAHLVASLHWGYEHEHLPREDQVRCVEELWDLGFSAVIGHHPHIVQPSLGDASRWVSFSLGDFSGGDSSVWSRFSTAVSFRYPLDPREGGAPAVEALPLVQEPYYAGHRQTCLLDEAPRFERWIWDNVFRPKIRSRAIMR